MMVTDNPLVRAAGIVGTTVATGGVMVAQQVQQGLDGSTSFTIGVFLAGSSALGLVWKAMRADQARAAAERDAADAEVAAMRRAEDARQQAALDAEREANARLRARVDELVDRLIEQSRELLPTTNTDTPF